MRASKGDISMQSVRFTLAILALLVLAACYPPVTRNPIGTTVGLKPDPAILGTWKSQPDPDNHRAGYYHFLSQQDGAITVVLVPDKGDASDVLLARLTTARLGKVGFMNVRLMDTPKTEAKDQPPGTVPILYRIDAKGILSLYMLDEDLTKAAIKAHKLAGDAGKEGTDDATITADGPALDKFFQSPAGLALFTKPFGVLHRID
jgi:hypothetical protein